MVIVVSNKGLGSINVIGTIFDKTAIGLSAVCAIHCLALPIALTLLPSIASLPLGDESFHQVLIFLVLPTSVIALTLGCRRHRQWNVMGWGFLGLIVLLFTALLGHDFLGEHVEKLTTVLGTMLVAMSHTMNFRRCRSFDCHQASDCA